MQDVIRKCFEKDPDERPSFNEIFGQFETANFGIVPSGDSNQICEFCRGVLEWEEQAGVRI
jgi:hypothetical protein